jgi:hypothetical protein
VGRPDALDLGVRRGDPPVVGRPRFLLMHLERGARHGREERGGQDGGLGAGWQTGAAVATADWVQDGNAIDWARGGARPRSECARQTGHWERRFLRLAGDGIERERERERRWWRLGDREETEDY